MSNWPEDEFATHECHRQDGGLLFYIKTEYGSLGEGGSYELWRCTVHGDHWFNLSD